MHTAGSDRSMVTYRETNPYKVHIVSLDQRPPFYNYSTSHLSRLLVCVSPYSCLSLLSWPPPLPVQTSGMIQPSEQGQQTATTESANVF